MFSYYKLCSLSCNATCVSAHVVTPIAPRCSIEYVPLLQNVFSYDKSVFSHLPRCSQCSATRTHANLHTLTRAHTHTRAHAHTRTNGVALLAPPLSLPPLPHPPPPCVWGLAPAAGARKQAHWRKRGRGGSAIYCADAGGIHSVLHGEILLLLLLLHTQTAYIRLSTQALR